MSKSRLIERLEWYYPTERFHTFGTFPGLLAYALFHFPLVDAILIGYGQLVCIYILYQGQHYWKLKLNRLKNIDFDQLANIEFFKQSKRINFILISLMPLVVLIQLYAVDWQMRNSGFLWGLIASLFAILEHINYYHTQLMIDNKYDWEYLIKNRKLKESSLAKDLKENKF